MEFAQLAPLLAIFTKLDIQDIINARGCHIQLQNKMKFTIEWSERENKLFFYTSILDVSPNDIEALYEKLLDTHLFGQLTQDTYFGVHDAKDEVLLFHTINLDRLDEQQFFRALDTFAAQAKYWKKVLPQLQFEHAEMSLPYANFV